VVGYQRKELIICSGHNIDPASIEGPLRRHPAIQLAPAVGRPDAHSSSPALAPPIRTAVRLQGTHQRPRGTA
jgi:acyl-CoA synthetase (AMP-forming)/AMP-acid ligase II